MELTPEKRFLKCDRALFRIFVALTILFLQASIFASADESKPAITLSWYGKTNYESFNALPQIKKVTSNKELTESVSKAKSYISEKVFSGLKGKFSSKPLAWKLLNSDFVFLSWPSRGKDDSPEGWALAIKNADVNDFMLGEAAHRLGIGLDGLKSDSSEAAAGVVESKVVGEKIWRLGRFNDWLHLSSFNKSVSPKFIPELKIANALTVADEKAKGGRLMLLNADANRLPFSKMLFLGIGDSNLPVISVEGKIKNENIRIDGYFDFDQPLDISLSDWKLPESTLRDPVTGFTAIRGLKSIVKGFNKEVADVMPETDQMIVATEFHGQFSFVMRWFLPVDELKSNFDKSKNGISEVIGKFLSKSPFGRLSYNEEEPRLSWAGLPIIVPYLTGLDLKDDGNFLEIGFLPLKTKERKPVPQALLDQVTKSDNVIFYDWELTPQRALTISSLVNVYEILNYTTRIRTPGSAIGKNSPSPPNPQSAMKIIKALTNVSGNTVTQIQKESPTRWKFQKTSKLGLGSFEIVALSRFLSIPEIAGPLHIQSKPKKGK